MSKTKSIVKTRSPEGGLWVVNAYIFRYLRPKDGWLLVGSLLILLAGLPGKFHAASQYLLFVGLAGFAFSVFRIQAALRSVRNLVEKENKALPDFLRNLTLSPTDQTNGFELIELAPQEDWVTRSSSFDQLLRRSRDLQYEVYEEGAKKVQSRIRTYADVAEDLLRFKYRSARNQRKAFINEPKVGMHSNLPAEGPVKIYKTDYFSTLLTNDLVNETIYANEGQAPIHDGSDLYPAMQVARSGPGASQWELQSFAHSGLANHIGVSVLVVTADQWVVIWKQTHKNLRSVGLAAPSGSGSADWEDLRGSLTPKEDPSRGEFHRFLESAMIREFLEESHRRGAAVLENSIERIRTIGFFRWLSRGGKPEFVGVAKSSARFDDLTPNADEVYLDGKGGNGCFHFENLMDLMGILKNLIHHPDNSVPQEMNLQAWLRWMEEDPAEAAEFLGLEF